MKVYLFPGNAATCWNQLSSIPSNDNYRRNYNGCNCDIFISTKSIGCGRMDSIKLLIAIIKVELYENANVYYP